MNSTVLFIPQEDTYSVNSTDDFVNRSKLKSTEEILDYLENLNLKTLQDLRFHSDFFVNNLYPRDGQSYYILTTSSRIHDPICNVSSNSHILVERINHITERRVIVQKYPNQTWKLDSFTGEYLLGMIAHEYYPKGTLKYYGGYTCNNWNYLLKEQRSSDPSPLRSTNGSITGMYTLLLALKSIRVVMTELSWHNISIGLDASIKVGNFTQASYYIPNGILLQTSEPGPGLLPPLGKRVIGLMLLHDQVRSYLPKQITGFFDDFSQIFKKIMSILPENRLSMNVDLLLQSEFSDNTSEIESFLRSMIDL